MTVAVGIDAAKGGWVAVVLRESRLPSAHLLPTIDALADVVPDATVAAIDIPIGLPETGQRAADLAAKAVLGPRRSSVFMTPVRAALEAPTHAEATAISVAVTGSGISQQAFALRSKIFEVQDWLGRAPCPVFEVHPEVSFTMMLGQPGRAPKKSWHGLIERRSALAAVGIPLDNVDPMVGGAVAADDILDAAAAAWTATRVLAGTARSFPDPPEEHTSGRPVAIWA